MVSSLPAGTSANRKTSFKAFNSTCKNCGQVGQYTSVCKKPGDKKTKEEEVTANSVQIMHSIIGAININLCQLKVLGNESEYNKQIWKQLQTRPNTTLSI
jgi:hypothetical protein